jgi:hypothetical protein
MGEQRCPDCGGRVTYVGLAVIECATPGCARFRPLDASAGHARPASGAGGRRPDARGAAEPAQDLRKTVTETPVTHETDERLAALLAEVGGDAFGYF